MDRNYEQEYKKAFEAAKGLHDAGNALTKKQMEIVFPQLAESEDERIRKVLIHIVKGACNKYGIKYIGDEISEEKLLAYLEKQKEQKSVQSEVEREYVRTLKSLISDFIRGKENVDREYYQQIFDWLDGRHIEQKPAEVDESTKRLNENWMKQHFDDYKEQKPAEWSEEDELMIKCCFRAIEHYKYTWKRNVFRPSQFDIDGYLTSPEKVQTWLESLRNRVGKESLQPHWKPTEEQPESFDTAAFQKGVQEGRRLEREDVKSTIQSRIDEIMGDAQPNPILRMELQELIKKIEA